MNQTLLAVFLIMLKEVNGNLSPLKNILNLLSAFGSMEGGNYVTSNQVERSIIAPIRLLQHFAEGLEWRSSDFRTRTTSSSGCLSSMWSLTQSPSLWSSWWSEMWDKDKKDEKPLPSWGCAACAVHLWEPNHPLHKSLKWSNSSPPGPMLVKRLYGKFQMMNVFDTWELPADVALLNSLSTKRGESVDYCRGTWLHVRELECMWERESDHLIKEL